MSNRPKFAREAALEVATDIIRRLTPFCRTLVIAGSLRRGAKFVGDIEFLFIPAYWVEQDMFGEAQERKDLAAQKIDQLVTVGVIEKRAGATGHHVWGPQNKLARHIRTGIPIDFFTTTEKNWWNSLVVRTGGKASNLAITMAANKMGWSLEAYGSGFHDLKYPINHVDMHSEEEIFEFVGLPFLPPEKRK